MNAIRNRVVVGVVIVAALAVGLAWHLNATSRTRVVAYFADATGMYVGDRVTVLGVKVGKVAAIHPEKTSVKVDLEIDSKTPISQDVKAALVAPSLVSVRSVALGPAYGGGATLHDGDVIPLSRTSVPVEWDEVKDQLVKLSAALGPSGTDDKGALANLVTAGAGLLKGQGGSLQTTVNDLSEALSTLSDNRGDLFATVRNLQVFVAALQSSDAQVRSFNTRLADISTLVAGDGTELKGAFKSLRLAFGDVQSFLRSNTTITASTLSELRQTSSLLAENRQSIADVLQVAPTGVSNFYDIIDPRLPGPTGSLVLDNLTAPAEIICGSLLDLGGTAQDCRQAIGPIAKALTLDAPPVGLLAGAEGGGGSAEPTSPSSGATPQPPGGTSSHPSGGLVGGLLGSLLGGAK